MRVTPSDPAEQRARYMTLENMASLSVRPGIGPPDQFLIFLTPMISVPVVARLSGRPAPKMAAIFMASDTTQWNMIAQSG